METSDSNTLLTSAFETSLWLKLEDAKRGRDREEIAIDYDLVSGRVRNLRDDYLEGETLVSTRASEGMKLCTGLSDGLQKSNEMGTDLLTGLEELIEDLLFRLETIHHSGAQDESEDEDEMEPFCEETANTEITSLLNDRAKVKTKVEHNIISCNAKLSTIKSEISELVNSNPRNRRMSRHFKTLNFGAPSSGSPKEGRRSIFKTLEEDPEQFDPNTMDVNVTIKDIFRFINDQELPPEEANPAIAKVKAMHKFLDYLKKELKTANQRATDEQIKCNNLQNRIPKLEESREKLSQQIEKLQDSARDKDTTIAKLNMKISSMENMANKPSTATVSKDRQESNASAKQAVVPKSTLREILQSSDKEVEEKLKVLAASNEAIRVVLVRKNKQIRQLEGTIIQLNAETTSQKSKIEKLEESIISGTADANAIREEREEEENGQDAELELPPHDSPAVQSTIDESVYLDSDDMTTPAPDDFNERVMIDGSTNTEIEMEEAYTQTHEYDADDDQIIIPDMGDFRIKRKRRGSRKASIAMMAAEDGIRKAARRASTISSSQRKGSMAPKDMFGIGAGTHSLTKSDLATVHEFQRHKDLNDKTIKQVEDISVLQKYIASMREQTERSMEKIREFIAKEKTRNDANIRRLINEHEKFLSNHKKEFNKVFYSIQRFKEMMIEILNGKDITQIVPQTTFKTELSPIQLRIQSTETLSSLEFDVFQAIKQKDMKIRDLSGRKRLDDKHLDRRIKEREKAVFSILDHMNERLKKEKEIVSKKEKWVNEKIKIEMEYEKAQENEVQSIEKALVKFWKDHPELVGALGAVQSSGSEVKPPSPTPSASPRLTNTSPVTPPSQHQQQHQQQLHQQLQRQSEQQQLQRQSEQQQLQRQSDQQISPPQSVFPSPPTLAEQAELMEQSFVPRLYIRVTDQRNNLLRFDMAHRAGVISNLAHKLISNIIDRWLELIEKKICRLFRAYIKYRRFSDLQTEVMKDDEDDGSNDMNRSMTLHRRIRNSMDFQHKKLRLELGKLSTYCGNLLEEEDYFFDTVSDTKLLKSVVRPAFHQINCNVMFKKLLEVTQEKRSVQVTMPHVIESCSSNMTAPTNLEEIPVMKQVANDKDTGSWTVDYKKESEAKSLLVPKILQLDTNKMCPMRMVVNQPLQIRPHRSNSARRRCVSGLPPIPYSERISYIPTIASIWSSKKERSKNSELQN